MSPAQSHIYVSAIEESFHVIQHDHIQELVITNLNC